MLIWYADNIFGRRSHHIFSCRRLSLPIYFILSMPSPSLLIDTLFWATTRNVSVFLICRLLYFILLPPLSRIRFEMFTTDILAALPDFLLHHLSSPSHTSQPEGFHHSPLHHYWWCSAWRLIDHAWSPRHALFITLERGCHACACRAMPPSAMRERGASSAPRLRRAAYAFYAMIGFALFFFFFFWCCYTSDAWCHVTICLYHYHDIFALFSTFSFSFYIWLIYFSGLLITFITLIFAFSFRCLYFFLHAFLIDIFSFIVDVCYIVFIVSLDIIYWYFHYGCFIIFLYLLILHCLDMLIAIVYYIIYYIACCLFSLYYITILSMPLLGYYFHAFTIE